MKLKSIWISGVGYKRVADVTPEDLDARAAMYDRLMRGMGMRAEWCRETAALMRAEGARTLGKLKTALPVLPDDASIAELVAV